MFLFHGYPHIILDANKYSPACNILLVHGSILTAILVNSRLVTLDSNFEAKVLRVKLSVFLSQTGVS